NSKKYIDLIKKSPEGATNLPTLTASFPNIKELKKYINLSDEQENKIRNDRAAFEWDLRTLLAQNSTKENYLKLKDKYFKETESLFSEENGKKIFGEDDYLK